MWLCGRLSQMALDDALSLDMGWTCPLALTNGRCGIPGSSVIKNPPTNAGDMGPILRLERSPGEGNGNLLQYSCLENPSDRGSWWATVHGDAKDSDMT